VGVSRVDHPAERVQRGHRRLERRSSHGRHGARLVIGETTARYHLISLLNKLGADNRTRVVARATQEGLLYAFSDPGVSAGLGKESLPRLARLPPRIGLLA
jgi:hypothetical protein